MVRVSIHIASNFTFTFEKVVGNSTVSGERGKEREKEREGEKRGRKK